MKRQLLTGLLCLAAIIAVNVKGNAQSTLIHYWHFNNFTWSDTSANAIILPTIAHPGIFGLDADFSILDTSKAKILYTRQAGVSSSWPDTNTYHVGFTFIDDYSGTGVNVRMGVDSGFGLRTRNPSDSMELRFYIPTTNHQNIVLKYACERSGSGMLQQVFDYSSDSGATWKVTGLSATSDTVTASYSLFSVGLADASANNNPKLVFRMKFVGQNNTPNGNDRFDNVTVEGDTLGAVGSKVVQLNANSATYTLSPNPATNSLVINSSLPGEKFILIYNSLGQSVLTEIISDKQTLINTANFNSGNYYISIRENSTGRITTIPFIKQ